MLPSAKERKRSVHNFMNYYSDLCQVQNTCPIRGIKINLPNKVLDFVGDGIKLSDWQPILKALSYDRYLHYVAVRSKQAKKNVLENVDSEEKARQVTKSPVFFTDFILTNLIKAVSKCLSNSTSLSYLQLERIPLDNKLIKLLIEGLQETTSLQHLSLKHCHIGDEGCKLLCFTLRDQCKLITLDLSGCALTEVGAKSIAGLIKIQNLNHYDETWKQSLRYRPVDPENMPGLRRITLNNNPQIGDAGVISIIDQLPDDMWIKAIDFQNCGITSFGAKSVLELVKKNKYLSVVDIRANNNIVPAIVSEIMALLEDNVAGNSLEFQWHQEDTQSFKTTTSNGLYKQNSLTSTYNTGVNYRRNTGACISNPSFRVSKYLPPKRSNLTIGSSGCLPRRCVGSAENRRIEPVVKSTKYFKKSDEERELEKLRHKVAEETTLRIAAEEKLKELNQFHNNGDDYVYTEKAIMKEVAQICENFVAMIIANKLPHSRSFYVALSLSKLMTNSNLNGNMIAETLNEIKDNNNDLMFLPSIHCDQKQTDLSDCSMNTENQDSETSYASDSTDSYDEADSKAKLIFQSLLSTPKISK